MKVLQINATYGMGSTGRNVLEMDSYLREKGHQSYVAWGSATTNHKDENIFQVGNWFDHKWHAILRRITGKQGYYSKSATKKLCKKIETIQPDIIHLHNLHSNYICLPMFLEYLAKKDYPVMITLHDCWFFTGGCYFFNERDCYEWRQSCEKCPLKKAWNIGRNASSMLQVKETQLTKLTRLGVVGVSDWITEKAKTSILKDSFLIKRIYNWIDHNIFKPVNVDTLRKTLGVGTKKVVLGISQGWSARKGLGEMIQIAENLGDEVLVLLVGEMNHAENLPDNIISLGYVGDINVLAQYYSLADVFVNPSRMETFGKVTAEAMACGTPVVVYGNTGTKELVKEGCGLIAKDGDVEELLLCVKQILQQPKEVFAKNCIMHARREFNIQVQLGRYEELYYEIIKGR